MPTLLQRLEGGDLRSIGRVKEVTRVVGHDQKLFDEVFDGMFHENPVVRSRSADAVEKSSKQFPHLLQSHRKSLIAQLRDFHQQEVQWHIALMLGRIELTKKETVIVIDALLQWLDETQSIIVKVNCLQMLADIALKNTWFKDEATMAIEEQMLKGSPAIKARGRMLLKQLQKI